MSRASLHADAVPKGKEAAPLPSAHDRVPTFASIATMDDGDDYPSMAKALPAGSGQEAKESNPFGTEGTHLLELRKRLRTAEDECMRKRSDFANKEKAFKLKEHEIKTQESELQKQLVKFNRFLQENDMKRTRASRKAEEESRVIRHLGEECDNLQKQIHDLRDECSRREQERADNIPFSMRLPMPVFVMCPLPLWHMRDALTLACGALFRYGQFLQDFLDNTEEFDDITEVMDRHKNLSGTRRKLQDHDDEVTAALEKAQKTYADYMKDRKPYITQLQCRRAELQELVEQIGANVLDGERQYDRTRTSSAMSKLLSGQIDR